MAVEKYDVGDTVPFTHFVALADGQGISGLDVRIDLIDLITGIPIFNAQAMPEIVSYPGLYYYIWNTSAINSRRIFVVLIYVQLGAEKRIVDEFNLIIDDTKNTLIEKIDDADGSAV